MDKTATSSSWKLPPNHLASSGSTGENGRSNVMMISQWRLLLGMSVCETNISEKSPYTVHSPYKTPLRSENNPEEASYEDDWAEQEEFLGIDTEEIITQVTGNAEKYVTPDSVSSESPPPSSPKVMMLSHRSKKSASHPGENVFYDENGNLQFRFAAQAPELPAPLSPEDTMEEGGASNVVPDVQNQPHPLVQMHMPMVAPQVDH